MLKCETMCKVGYAIPQKHSCNHHKQEGRSVQLSQKVLHAQLPHLTCSQPHMCNLHIEFFRWLSPYNGNHFITSICHLTHKRWM